MSELTETAMAEVRCREIKRRSPKSILMDTDWLLDEPHDLEQNWLIKCVPQGYRVLLIVNRNYASCYKFSGKHIFKLPTNFCLTSKSRTILDCVYHKNSKTIFVLDCLQWNTCWLKGVEARYRFSWLEDQFRENTQFSSCYIYKFVLIPAMPAEKSLIQDAMSKSFQVNDRVYFYQGIAFYRKFSLYTTYPNEHVGWLNSFMLDEVLGIKVSQQHLVKQPENYKSASQHLEDKAREKLKNKRGRRKRKRMRRYYLTVAAVVGDSLKSSEEFRPKKKRGRKKKCTKKKKSIPIIVGAETVVPVSTEEQNLPTDKQEKGKKRRHTEREGDFPKRTMVEMKASSNSKVVEKDTPGSAEVEKAAPAGSKVEKDTPGSSKVGTDAPESFKVEEDTPGSSTTAIDIPKEKRKAEEASEKVGVTKKIKVEADVYKKSGDSDSKKMS